MTEYYYNLHVVHDISTSKIGGGTEQDPKYKVDGITGHFYTVLVNNDPSLEKRTTFSYGPKMSDMPVWPGHIDPDDESRIDKFSGNIVLTKDAVHIKKSVPLTKGQDIKANPGMYVLGPHDCMAVSQAIWQAVVLTPAIVAL